jgi:polysaccharide export outer membrane protein
MRNNERTRYGGIVRAKIAGLAAAFFSLCLAGCNAPLAPGVLQNPATFDAPDVPPLASVSRERKLTIGDVVTINVYKVESMSGDQTIDDAGYVTLPLIGAVQAAGDTTAQLQEALTRSLGARYLTAPVVSVTLKAAMQRTVTVAGSVQQPGIYPIETNPTLLRTVAMAHGVTDDANPRRVVIFRQINGQRMAASFDLKGIQRGIGADPAIYPDDVIVVDGSALSKTFKTVIEALPFATLFRPY